MEDTVNTITSLPDDPQALKQIILDLSRQRDERMRALDSREQTIATLQQQTKKLEEDCRRMEVEKLRLEMALLRLRKWYYGPRADNLRHYTDSAQMLLAFGTELEARPIDPADLPPASTQASPGAAESSTPSTSSSVRRVGRGRRDLAAFENLPVTRKEYDLPEAEKACPCCGGMRCRIGEESSWQVEFIPGHFERIEHVRIKYACKQCEHNAENPNIVLADKPVQPIEKGMAGPGLLAYVITSKYADYLPLYRLEAIFGRNGLEIDRSTQGIWCRDVAEIVSPLYERMIQCALQSHVLCTDDTVMPMLAPGKAKKARIWVYVGDEHHPYNVFDFTLGRGRDGPALFLAGYKEILLADAYGGYDGVVVGNDIVRAGCWAHARRKFVDAEKTHPAIAAEAVGIIKRLYAIEDRGKGLDVAARGALRQKESVPILKALKEKLFTWRDQLLPKHPMAEAVRYTLNQWNELSVFTTNGAVPIDNNVSEREMKRIVLNRKNSLFVGNERGGQTAAILSSMTSTCRRHGIDPQLYLTQLLTNLPGTPLSQLDQWLPDRWKQNHPRPSG